MMFCMPHAHLFHAATFSWCFHYPTMAVKHQSLTLLHTYGMTDIVYVCVCIHVLDVCGYMNKKSKDINFC